MTELHTSRLFLGGPWDGREAEIPANRDLWLVAIVGGGVFRYQRVRMFDANTLRFRALFVPDTLNGLGAERILWHHLLRRWIAEAPDA